jgi:DNA polymerase III epsilon subunit-like protein
MRAQHGSVGRSVDRVIDTLVLARRKHAGGLTLDDLCSRYGVDRSHRGKHGALLDAELLAAVYVPKICRQSNGTCYRYGNGYADFGNTS